MYPAPGLSAGRQARALRGMDGFEALEEAEGEETEVPNLPGQSALTILACDLDSLLP